MRKTNFIYFIFFVFVFFVLFQSCKKDQPISALQFQRNLVAGTGTYDNLKKIWKLDSLAIDGKGYTLTVNQKKYTKTLTYTGGYSDSDGFSGTWEIKNLDELILNSISAISGTKTVSTYQITDINSTQMNLQLKGSTNKYEYFFKISN